MDLGCIVARNTNITYTILMKRTLIISSIVFAFAIIVPMNVLAQNNGASTYIVNPEESEGLGDTTIEETIKGRVEGLEFLLGPVENVCAGDTIRGIERDIDGHLRKVNVVEIDKNDRIQAYSVSDENGEFSFRAVDPKNNKIEAALIGYKTFSSQINSTYFYVFLNIDTTFKNEPVIIHDDTILKEFEGLGITTVEEAQNRRLGLDLPIPVENTVNAGDTIRGIVRDRYGPMMQVNVVEIDKNKKVQAYSVSDYNGKFSFRAVDPKRNKIQVSFVGYETVSSSIDTTYFDIKMMDIHNDQVIEIR